MNKTIYSFEVETVKAGQERRYGDSYYHYIVKNTSDVDWSEFVIRQFCVNFLRPAVEKDKMKTAFDSYITEFKKIEDKTYSYKVTSPSTD